MKMRFLIVALGLLAGCSGPEAGSGAPVIEARPAGAWTAGAMVAAANPMAVEAGLDMLRRGGTAMDAAVAVQAVLGLVEPQSSGIGGGAFLLYYDAATGDVTAYDGREVAPAGATPDMFMDGAEPMGFGAAVRSGRSVGAPGAVAMLAMAHGDHGKLAFGAALGPAIALAEGGFPVPRRMREMTALLLGFGPLPAEAAAYLTPDGKTPWPEGHVIRNAAYADTLKRIAAEGPKGFYEGPVAEAIVAAVQADETPGTLALSDLSAYQPRRLEPLCLTFRVDLVCGMGPPSSGGLAVANALGILERLPRAAPGSAEAWHQLIEAERLAYADRDLYAADDRFVSVPVAGLLDPAYLDARAGLVAPDRAMAEAKAGTPPGAPKRAADSGGAWTGTSHFVIVDAAGNAVSMTTTVESIFGSQRMAAGFFLNNQLTDFSFRPTDEAGLPIANAVAAGKKPRSSMAPTLVFREGRFHLAAGSPGGNAIIGYVLKTLVATLDWGMEPQAAVALPNVVARGRVLLEPGFDVNVRAALTAMGHDLGDMRSGEASGLHAIMLGADGRLTGGADPRRDGVAATP